MRARTSTATNWHMTGWSVLLLITAILFAVSANAQAAPTLTVTAKTTPGGGSVVPILTWSTSPAAQSCTASGDAAWSGTKAASGTQTLAAITTSKTYQMACTWPGDTTATISWVPVMTHTDGTAMVKCTSQTDTGSCMRSFLVVRGSDATSVGMDSKAVDDRNATSYAWTGLSTGTHWFSVIVITGDGVQSDQATPPVSKTITSAQNATQSVAITVNPKPSAASGLAVQ